MSGPSILGFTSMQGPCYLGLDNKTISKIPKMSPMIKKNYTKNSVKE
jgi:hypothetical protein